MIKPPSIHPFEVKEKPLVETTFNLLSGHAVCFPFDVTPTETKFTMRHLPGRQDFSIRCWIGDEPISEQQLIRPKSLVWWHATQADRTFTILDETVAPDFYLITDALTGVLPPGRYFLNCLNLVNTDNSFVLRFHA